MYPCFVWTWAPVIYSPLSGSVTQDIAPTFVSVMSGAYVQLDVISSQLSIIREQNDALARAMLGPAALSAETGEQGDVRGKLDELEVKFARLERQGREARVQGASALLELIRRHDPAEYARIMQTEALRGGRSAPQE